MVKEARLHSYIFIQINLKVKAAPPMWQNRSRILIATQLFQLHTICKGLVRCTGRSYMQHAQASLQSLPPFILPVPMFSVQFP